LNTRLGCLTGTGLVSAVIALIAVTVFGFASGGEIFSSGALSTASASEALGGVWSHEEIECQGCHTPFWGQERMGDRCLDCHTPTKNELRDPIALHGKLADPTNCRECHTEHNGPHAELTILDGQDFPHEEFGFSLAAHQKNADRSQFSCDDCHSESLRLFEVETCSTCHFQLDENFTVTHVFQFGMQCLECHDGVDSYGADFDHQETDYPLDGEHLATSCEGCHLGASTLINLQNTSTNCFACHIEDDIHEERLGRDCAACHNPANWQEAELDHNLTRFPLAGGHIDTACEECHIDNVFVGTPGECIDCHLEDDIHEGQLGSDCFDCHKVTTWDDLIDENFDHNLTRFILIGKHVPVACEDCHLGGQLKGTPSTCVACHDQDDVHNGELGSDCAACHSEFDWTDSKFDHDLTAFRLTGKHISTSCEACHVDGSFKGTATACISCHKPDDIHGGAFGSNCASCHVTSGWTDSIFDHNQSAFPLTGSHKQTACSQCHSNDVFKGTPKNCFACHARDDAHNDEFGRDCAACHGTGKWGDANFNHNQTDFPLTGRHLLATCKACHANGIFDGTPKTCVSCHQQDDAHNGAFGNECAACHTTDQWAGANFDHNQTAFPLVGKHVNAPCTQCHINNTYQGTPQTCFACHSDDDDHNGEFGSDCAACHNSNNWGDAAFDHNQTAFPLAGKHQNTTCTKCHQNGVYAGTPKTCIACHSGDDAHNGAFGSDCASCHTPKNWDASFDHNQTSFPLAGKHQTTTCTKCHGDGVYDGKPTACIACHAGDDSHNGAFGSDCAACHTPTNWDASFNHNQTSFPLTGKHQDLTCANCHSDGVYDGKPTACIACHAGDDSHNDSLGIDCAACHNTSKWGDADFAHSFPLKHGDADSQCATCHPNTTSTYTCYNCHKHDPDKMAEKHAEEDITDLSNCANCHPNGKSD
jgi:hypothetical protein